MRKKLLSLAIVGILAFAYLSYTVAKERWQSIDFDTMVKIQDRVPRKFDPLFSYFTFLGNIEITLGICILMAMVALVKGKFLPILGWLMIIPASAAEVFGKLILFHPSPPVFFHRTILPANLPEFYIHTNFSYPSGHMTRTIFIITIILSLVIFSEQKPVLKFIESFVLISFAFMVAFTRVYLGEHWISDVLGGILLGSSAGVFASVFILSDRRESKDLLKD